jgi:hypothetical protein
VTSLPEDIRARAFSDRIIPGQQHRSSRHYLSQQKSQQPAGQLPCRPASLRQHPMLGGDMSRCLRAYGPYNVGDGLAASRHDSPEPQHEEPVIRWRGKGRLKHPQDWHRNIW